MSDSSLIQLDIVAADFAGVFDVLEVWRSLVGEQGPYTEITADDWKTARLPLSGGDPPASPVTGASAALVGKTLVLKVDDTDIVTVTFTGSDPMTRATAATQIQVQSIGRLTSYVDALGQLVIATVDTGSGALLELTDGTAAGDLGLVIGSVAYGKEPRIQLIGGQTLYRFSDLRGQDTGFYRTRYRNRSTSATSDFSQPFGGSEASSVTDASLVVGQADLVDARGRPLAFRSVLIHTDFNGLLVDGKLMAGGDLDVVSDEDGHVEVMLVRGQAVTVAVAGTDLRRAITVPIDPAVVVFNLFDPSLAGPDIFRVQIPELVYAERRSL